MAASSGSGTSSAVSLLLPNSGSEEDLQAAMDRRKQKRMLSNRESARRSRQRKQKHVDDLMIHVARLRKENEQILAALAATNQRFFVIEADNSVLRTQMVELSTRLQSLNEIMRYMNGAAGCGDILLADSPQLHDDGFIRPWNPMFMNQQPIMASADVFHYC